MADVCFWLEAALHEWYKLIRYFLFCDDGLRSSIKGRRSINGFFCDKLKRLLSNNLFESKELLINDTEKILIYTFWFVPLILHHNVTETNWSFIIIYKTIQGISCKWGERIYIVDCPKFVGFVLEFIYTKWHWVLFKIRYVRQLYFGSTEWKKLRCRSFHQMIDVSSFHLCFC